MKEIKDLMDKLTFKPLEQESKAYQFKTVDASKQKDIIKKREASLPDYIPRRYVDNVWGDYRPDTPEHVKALSTATKYVNEDMKCNFVLSGEIGTGKTMLACLILKHKHLEGKRVLFSTIDEIIAESRSSMSYSGNMKTVNKYHNFDYLAIDEIGRQTGSVNENNLLFAILNKRYNNMLPTIIITNEEGEGLTSYLGDAIIDRMKEDKSLFITFSGKSLR